MCSRCRRKLHSLLFQRRTCGMTSQSCCWKERHRQKGWWHQVGSRGGHSKPGTVIPWSTTTFQQKKLCLWIQSHWAHKGRLSSFPMPSNCVGDGMDTSLSLSMPRVVILMLLSRPFTSSEDAEMSVSRIEFLGTSSTIPNMDQVKRTFPSLIHWLPWKT